MAFAFRLLYLILRTFQMSKNKPEYFVEYASTILTKNLQTTFGRPPFSNVALDQYTRLAPADISALYGVLEKLPKSYVDTVFDKTGTSISGDVYYGKIEDAKSRKWDGFIIERPSSYGGSAHITQDTFALSSYNQGDVAPMFYHAHYSGRYMPPLDYDSFRGNLIAGNSYKIPPASTDLSAGGFIAKGFENIRVNCGKR